VPSFANCKLLAQHAAQLNLICIRDGRHCNSPRL